jgi:hypothetical protein
VCKDIGKKRAEAVTQLDLTRLHSKVGEERGRVEANRAIATVRAVFMGLWLAIRSINGREMAPCLASEGTLGELLGVSRHTIRRRFEKLRKVPGLLFGLPRGKRKRAKGEPWTIRPAARWAADPAEADRFKKTLRWQLNQIAMEAGLDSEWREAARGNVDAHIQAMETLGRRMREDLLETCAPVLQDADGRRKGKGGGGGKGGAVVEGKGPGGKVKKKRLAG